MFCPMPQESVNNTFYLNMYFELIYALEISTVKKTSGSHNYFMLYQQTGENGSQTTKPTPISFSEYMKGLLDSYSWKCPTVLRSCLKIRPTAS